DRDRQGGCRGAARRSSPVRAYRPRCPAGQEACRYARPVDMAQGTQDGCTHHRGQEMTGGTAAEYWAAHPLIAPRRVEFLDAPMHLLTMDETLSLAIEAMTGKVPLHHTVVNVAKLVNMRANDELRQDVSEADLINIDGAGVVWGARLLGIRVPERV